MLPFTTASQKSQSFLRSLPFFTFSLCLMVIGTYLLSLILPNLQDYIVNEPEATITKYQIWRIWISFMIHESIVPLTISLIFFVLIFASIEKKQGSVYFILCFFMDIIIIQSCFCLTSFIIWKLGIVKFYSQGLYSIILMRIAYVPPTLPTSRFPFLKHLEKIPHKYFSSGVFILFAFTNQLNVLDLLCAILISFAEIKIEKALQNQKIFDKIVNEQFLLEIEEKIFKSVSQQEQFVRVEEAIRGQEEGDYQVFDNDTLIQETQNQSSQSSDYIALPKGKEIKEEIQKQEITKVIEEEQVN